MPKDALFNLNHEEMKLALYQALNDVILDARALQREDKGARSTPEALALCGLLLKGLRARKEPL